MRAGTEAFIPQRYWVWSGCILAGAAFFALVPWSAYWLVPAMFFASLALVGLWDFAQSGQAIRRNYPLIAHLRFFMEFIRPEIRQYFLEADRDEAPFSRAQRSIVYQRAKEVVGAAGISHPSDLGPEHIVRRVSSNEVRALATLHHWVKPGELLSGVPDHPVYKVFWAASRSGSFAPLEVMRTVSTTKPH